MRKAQLNQSLGSVVRHTIGQGYISLDTATERAIVSVYTDNIIRLRIFKIAEEATDLSYAVIAAPQAGSSTIREEADRFILTTATTTLHIQRSPLRFSFYDKAGTLLCEDDAAFGTSWIQSEVTTYKKLQAGERFIGLGEKTGDLDRRGNAYTNWNTDKFAYPTDQDPLYMTVPFYIGIHSGVQYGIFLDNTHKSKFNFGASNDRFAAFGAEGGDMNYYFINGASVAEIIEQYTLLTGRMELPPMWSLGTQQCRYSYYPDSEVVNLARTFRDKKIPADVIYLDIHYMDEYKVFTFHPERFPEPEKMIADLKSMGFHTAVILDPGIKVQQGYKPYEEGIKADHFVKYPDGQNYSGEVWPSWSHFPDFTKEQVRQWWGSWVSFYTDKGIDALWNDMNEPAAWGQSLPDLIEFHYEGETATHKQARNIYGMQMARSTYEGAKKLLKGKRPFVLNRAGYSGVQRYTASWTGDNVASSDHMLCGVRLVNSMGLSGIGFAGFDVGGFADDASPDLFARWLVLGVFSPMFRFHSGINTRDAEPWAFGEEVEEIARHYITLRYRLMPYIYGTFYQSSRTGLPVNRSLAIDYTHDAMIYDSRYQNQYLFGDAFMIAPVAAGKDFIKVYLPASSEWYDLHTGTRVPGAEYIAEVRKERYPVFVKGSSIIPMQSAIQSMSEKPTDVLELHLYNGAADNSITYYEDDGTSYDYEQGKYYQRQIHFSASQKQLKLSAAAGAYSSHFRTIQLYYHGFDALSKVSINGKEHATNTSDYQFVAPVSSFDPYYKVAVGDMMNKGVPSLSFAHSADEIIISW
jgi:alpha-glucosidase